MVLLMRLKLRGASRAKPLHKGLLQFPTAATMQRGLNEFMSQPLASCDANNTLGADLLHSPLNFSSVCLFLASSTSTPEERVEQQSLRRKLMLQLCPPLSVGFISDSASLQY